MEKTDSEQEEEEDKEEEEEEEEELQEEEEEELEEEELEGEELEKEEELEEEEEELEEEELEEEELEEKEEELEEEEEEDEELEGEEGIQSWAMILVQVLPTEFKDQKKPQSNNKGLKKMCWCFCCKGADECAFPWKVLGYCLKRWTSVAPLTVCYIKMLFIGPG